MKFAVRVCEQVKSNAIVMVQGVATVGIGPGQTSRVEAVKIAARRAGDRARRVCSCVGCLLPIQRRISSRQPMLAPLQLSNRGARFEIRRSSMPPTSAASPCSIHRPPPCSGTDFRPKPSSLSRVGPVRAWAISLRHRQVLLRNIMFGAWKMAFWFALGAVRLFIHGVHPERRSPDAGQNTVNRLLPARRIRPLVGTFQPTHQTPTRATAQR